MTVIFYSESLDATLCVHGDDFLVEGVPESLDKVDQIMSANFAVKILRRVGPGASSQGNFLNRSIEWSSEGFALEADEKHAKVLIESLSMEGAKGVECPGSKATEKNLRDAEEELIAEWAAWYRSLAGRELYLVQDRYDMQQSASTLMADMQKPTQLSWERLKRTVRYLKQYPRLIYHYKYQEILGELVIDGDSDWAGGLKTRKSTTGIYEEHGTHCIDHAAVRQATIALSSGEAEFGAIVKAAAGGLETVSILNEVNVKTKLRMRSDSAAARGILHRRGVGRLRHLDIKDLWVQEKVQNGNMTVDKVDTNENRGDIGTKALDGSKLTYLLSLTSLKRRTDWRAGGLVAALMLQGADGAAPHEVKKMILGSGIGWIVGAALDTIKEIATTAYKVQMWMMIMVVMISVAVGYCAGKARGNNENNDGTASTETPTSTDRNRAVFGAGVMSEEEITDGPREPQHPTLIQRTPSLVSGQQQMRGTVMAPPTGSAQMLAAQNARLRLEAELAQRTVVGLRVELRRRGLPVSGLKTDLIRRLCNNWE